MSDDLPPLLRLPTKSIKNPYTGARLYERESVRDYAQRYGAACAAAAVAKERERCAVVAWRHYMDQCKARRIAAADSEHWCAAAAIRAGS